MYRYIAFAWNSGNTHAATIANTFAGQLRRSPWKTVFDAAGLLVLQTGDIPGRMQAYRLPADRRGGANSEFSGSGGVVLGKLFSRRYIDSYQPGAPAPEEVEIEEREAREIVASRGRYLIDHYWGKYIAFITDQRTGTHSILRTPSGAMPCFYAQYKDVEIYFSDMEDCASLDGLRFSINWPLVHKYLLFSTLNCSETGLTGVSKLMPGECRTTASHTAENQYYWNPVTVAQKNILEAPEQAAEALRLTTMGCIAAWASCYRHVAHKLSGGLDSTIVLGCLEHGFRQQTTAPKRTYLHYLSDEVDSNERDIARMAAAFNEVELFERPFSSAHIDYGDLASMPRTAVPTNYYYGLGAARFDFGVAKDTGAEVFFSGNGGDEIFLSVPIYLGAIDYARRHGFGRPLLNAAMDAARVSRTSFWAVMREVLKDRLLRRPADPYGLFASYQAASVINADIRNSASLLDTEHPLLVNANGLPPGKRFHIYSLNTPTIEGEVARRDQYVELLHPLHSQPLVELCLRIPTDVLTITGRNRGLARRAFRGLIAPQIIQRESKGAGSNHMRRVFYDNIGLVREWLMDGILVREGILDKKILEQSLSGNQHDITVPPPHLLAFVSIEKWLQDWNGMPMKMAV